MLKYRKYVSSLIFTVIIYITTVVSASNLAENTVIPNPNETNTANTVNAIDENTSTNNTTTNNIIDTNTTTNTIDANTVITENVNTVQNTIDNTNTITNIDSNIKPEAYKRDVTGSNLETLDSINEDINETRKANDLIIAITIIILIAIGFIIYYLIKHYIKTKEYDKK